MTPQNLFQTIPLVEVIKRPRGRPRKEKVQLIKIKQKVGRKRKHESGKCLYDVNFQKKLVNREEYYLLKAHEKEYDRLIKIEQDYKRLVDYLNQFKVNFDD
jgi:hypothetical protein